MDPIPWPAYSPHSKLAAALASASRTKTKPARQAYRSVIRGVMVGWGSAGRGPGPADRRLDGRRRAAVIDPVADTVSALAAMWDRPAAIAEVSAQVGACYIVYALALRPAKTECG